MRTVSTAALLIAALLLARSGAIAGQVSANGHYQQFARTTACGGSEAVSCTLTFGALPAGKNLIVRQVSCFMAMISGGVRYVALESHTPTGAAPIARTFITPINGTGAGFNTASVALTHVVAAGQRLKVHVNFTSGQLFSVERSVVGDLLAS